MNKRFPCLLIIVLLGIISVIAPTISTVSYTVDVNTNKDKYYRYEMVYITVTVTSGGTPVEGVDVAVEVKDPDGFTIYTDQGKTNSDGKVTFHFRLNPDAKYGWYDVIATITGGSGSTRFEVIPRPPVGGRIEEINKIELLAIYVANNMGTILLISIAIIIAYIIILKLRKK